MNVIELNSTDLLPQCIKYDTIRKSRFNQRELKHVKEYLVKRDGNRCHNPLCKRSLHNNAKLLVDHVDNNRHRHSHLNLQLLCYSCNSSKNPRGKAKPKTNRNKVDNSSLCEKPTSTELYKSQKYKPIFLKHLNSVMAENKRFSKREFINQAALLTGGSHITMLRYLEIECCELGIYKIITYKSEEYIIKRLKQENENVEQLIKKYCS